MYLEPRLMLRRWKRPLNRGLSELSGLSAGAGSAVSAPPGSISLVTLSASKAFIFMEVIMGSPRSILALCVNWPEEEVVLSRFCIRRCCQPGDMSDVAMVRWCGGSGSLSADRQLSAHAGRLYLCAGTRCRSHWTLGGRGGWSSPQYAGSGKYLQSENTMKFSQYYKWHSALIHKGEH